MPSASEQLPAAPAIVREELYDADLGSFGPFSLGRTVRLPQALAENVIGYLTGLLLQGISPAITERALKWWWDGFPSERWLLPEDQRLTAEYKGLLSEATKRRFNLTLEAGSSGTNSEVVRTARMKRNQEIFYRCYRSIEKVSDQPQTFNAQYGLFRSLLTTFLLLALISLGFVGHRLWVARSFVLSSHMIFAAASIVGSIISYQRTRKRAKDFAKAVLDAFLVNNSPPGAS